MHVVLCHAKRQNTTEFERLKRLKRQKGIKPTYLMSMLCVYGQQVGRIYGGGRSLEQTRLRIGVPVISEIYREIRPFCSALSS